MSNFIEKRIFNDGDIVSTIIQHLRYPEIIENVHTVEVFDDIIKNEFDDLREELREFTKKSTITKLRLFKTFRDEYVDFSKLFMFLTWFVNVPKLELEISGKNLTQCEVSIVKQYMETTNVTHVKIQTSYALLYNIMSCIESNEHIKTLDVKINYLFEGNLLSTPSFTSSKIRNISIEQTDYTAEKSQELKLFLGKFLELNHHIKLLSYECDRIDDDIIKLISNFLTGNEYLEKFELRFYGSSNIIYEIDYSILYKALVSTSINDFTFRMQHLNTALLVDTIKIMNLKKLTLIGSSYQCFDDLICYLSENNTIEKFKCTDMCTCTACTPDFKPLLSRDMIENKLANNYTLTSFYAISDWEYGTIPMIIEVENIISRNKDIRKNLAFVKTKAIYSSTS